MSLCAINGDEIDEWLTEVNYDNSAGEESVYGG